MLTIEVMFIIAFTLLSSVIYTLYRHFNDHITCLSDELSRIVILQNHFSDEMADERKHMDERFILLEQKLKDGLQNNSICCRSAIDSGRSLIDKINSRIAILEKNQTGSINVVVPPLKQKVKKEIQ